ANGRLFCPSPGLIGFDEIANAQCIIFAVAVAGNWITATGRIDDNVGPDHTCSNFDRRYLGNRNAFLTAAEYARLHPAYPEFIDNDFCREDEIAFRPTARGKGFAWTNRIGIWGYTHSNAPFFQIQM